MQDADHTPGHEANCLSNPIRVGLATCPGCWLFLPGPLLHPRHSSSPESGWDAPTPPASSPEAWQSPLARNLWFTLPLANCREPEGCQSRVEEARGPQPLHALLCHAYTRSWTGRTPGLVGLGGPHAKKPLRTRPLMAPIWDYRRHLCPRTRGPGSRPACPPKPQQPQLSAGKLL